jgi:competence ComEA-like helix-hairpin-helix protein
MSRIQAAIILFTLAMASTALAARPDSPQQARTHPVARAVDINQAPAEDLEKLPGVGPKLAQQIVAYRTRHGPFRRIEDLLIIQGIGSKKWQALRPYVCVGCWTGK